MRGLGNAAIDEDMCFLKLTLSLEYPRYFEGSFSQHCAAEDTLSIVNVGPRLFRRYSGPQDDRGSTSDVALIEPQMYKSTVGVVGLKGDRDPYAAWQLP